MDEWSIHHARALYNIRYWSGGYFDIDEGGHLRVCPGRGAVGIDLHSLAIELEKMDLSPPVLVRFGDILRDRVDTLHAAFERAIEAEGFNAGFSTLYPIKVNQQRRVLEQILSVRNREIGLEAGSKPELMVVLAASPPGGVVVCNGYKDREYIRLALIGNRMGLRVYLVIEKLSELALVFEESEELGIEPLLGVRVRLASIGAGKWQNSGGEKSKFGLSATHLLQLVEQLHNSARMHTLQLMHFHLGSQIPNIHDIQCGLEEGARCYAELRRLGAPVGIVDVGGGLGVDYEGSRTRNFCSMNYTVQEYANNVVHALCQVCDEQNLPHPHIMTESGRAMTAHHAVLIVDVTEVEQVPDGDGVALPDDDRRQPAVVASLANALASLGGSGEGERSLLEFWHEAQHGLLEAQSLFTHGLLTLEQRSVVERLYFAICWRIHARLNSSSRAHRDVLDELNEKLADKYFCNFSLFQSLPDVWAIDQVFPIMPLHRLDEFPSRRGVLRDITCDSDGRIDSYVEGGGLESSLPLHAPRADERYLLGVFLVGAYQEILGDRHNLFGTTNTVNVELAEEGGYRLVDAVQGESVEEVLHAVTFSPAQLLEGYRSKLATSGEANADRYLNELVKGLSGYTYLEK